MKRVNLSALEFEYDPERPEPFHSGRFKLGPEVEAKDTGASVYELPPGQSVCPYHYEYGEEEWVLVLEGRPSLRTPEGTEALDPFDMVFFPKGPAGAHELGNETDSTVRVLLWSTVVYPSATAYPDSDKVGVWTGDKAEDLMAERKRGVDYFHGEV